MQVADPEVIAPTQLVTWQDVRERVKAINPELFDIIEQINPDSSLPLVLARYPYSSSIVHKGQMTLYDPKQPNKSVAPHEHSDPKIANGLNYTPIPLGLLLNKSCEVFVNACGRTVPLNLLYPGEIFGVYEVLDLLNGCLHPSMCSLSAGARSAFMLPKITDTNGNRRIKKEFGINHPIPKNLNEHWLTFSNIVNQHPFQDYWSCEILYFCAPWYEHEPTDMAWLKFRCYLYKHGWQQSSYARREETCGMILQALVMQAMQQRIRPKLHVLDHVKQLVAISTSTVPGFVPADEDELLLPSKLLKKIYVEVYGLKSYLPTIMQPQILNKSKNMATVYYSLAHPTMMECAIATDNPQALMSDQRDIKFLLENLNYNFEDSTHNEISIVRNEFIRCKFDYFHSASDPYSEIKPSRMMPETDPRLVYDHKIFDERQFCASSPFLSACIQISLNQATTR